MTYQPFKIDFDALDRQLAQEKSETKTTRMTASGGSYVEINERNDTVYLSTSGGMIYRCTDSQDAAVLAQRLVTAWSNGDYTIEDVAEIKERLVR